MIQYGVAVLDKDLPLPANCVLSLDHPDSSEHVNIVPMEYPSGQGDPPNMRFLLQYSSALSTT